MEEVTHQRPYTTNSECIEICKKCSGTGVRYIWADDDWYHRGECHKEICETCKGSGRVIVKRFIEVTIYPYLSKNK